MDDWIHAGHELRWLRLYGFSVPTIDFLCVTALLYTISVISYPLIILSSSNPSPMLLLFVSYVIFLISTLRQSIDM